MTSRTPTPEELRRVADYWWQKRPNGTGTTVGILAGWAREIEQQLQRDHYTATHRALAAARSAQVHTAAGEL